MKSISNENHEMVSLNSELSEFNLQELEKRLETDPLAIGGLLDITSTSDLSSFSAEDYNCEQSGGCGCKWNIFGN